MKKNVLYRTNIFISVIIVLGFIVTSLISYHSNRGIYEKDVEYISTLTSQGIYHQIDSIFAKPINISLTMANDSLLKEMLAQENERADEKGYIQALKNYLLAYKEKYNYDSVFLVSKATSRYYYFNGIDRVLTPDNPENVWYYEMLESSRDYSLNIDNDEVATANNEIAIFINCKIKDSDGEIMGVIGVGFRADSLQEIFRQYERESNVKAYLVSGEGIIEVSTNQTGYERINLFASCDYPQLKEKILSENEDEQSFWYHNRAVKGNVVSRYVPNLGWHLIIENDMSLLEKQLNRQFYMGMLIISAVIVGVLMTIMNIIHKYNEQIVKLTIETEKKHRSVFQVETEKMYENIYEIDITHNRAASEETKAYFESLGVAGDTPYDQVLPIIAEKQIKEEYRSGYLASFCPENVKKAYEDGKESLDYDFLYSNDGTDAYYWMRITVHIFYWDEDASIRMFVFRQNINDEKNREKSMLEKMQLDSLSGLYNKAATQDAIRKSLADKPGRRYAFFILDIDNFKQVNDTLGHAAGDMVIAEFAQILKGQFEEGDVAGRIGGDEFVVFALAPSKEWAVKKADSLLGALHHEFVYDTERCEISASIGVALTPEAGVDFETLYKNADSALYRAKEHGKNRKSVYR